MSYIRVIITLIITYAISFTSCDNMFSTDDEKLIANAGSDQTTIVGSYVIIDASKSTGAIDWYKWEQDENNPGKVRLFSNSNDPIQTVGFIKEGIYKFRLTVMSGSQSSQQDEMQVTVNPNLHSKFEDPNLEIAIRYTLKKQNEELTEHILLTLDSLHSIVTPEDVSSLKGLEYCKNLCFLEMGLQNISDISPLASLTKLKRLGLDQNRKISDITSLANLTALEWLNLDSNLITDIFPLRNLVNLKYLNLQINPINNINAIANMTELGTLQFFQATLQNIYAIKDLNKLEKLWLVDCELEDISSLRGLINLKNLHLAFNSIKNINSLSQMTKLEWIALDKNSITDILPLKNLINLKYVRLWHNQITDIKPLVDNPGIGKGDIVGLNGNPLNEKSINEYIPILMERGVYVTWY